MNQPYYTTPMPISEAQLGDALGAAMRRVYLWMALGLMVTAGMAWLTVNTFLLEIVFASQWVFMGLLIAEIVMVIALSAAINRISPTTAVLLFFAYAALNGLTLSAIFLAYALGTIALAFVATSSLFGAMSIIGFTTKMDLSRLGGFLLMALIGLIVASIVNMFLANSTLDWILTYAGVFIFLGLTVYHTQRIKTNTLHALSAGDQTAVSRIGIMGALSLYLDFINLFLRLLRIMGRRK
jgi:FtsH-binding integral membrane protein